MTVFAVIAIAVYFAVWRNTLVLLVRLSRRHKVRELPGYERMMFSTFTWSDRKLIRMIKAPTE